MKAYISHFYYYKNVLIEKMPYARRAYGILMSGKNHEQRPKRTFSSYFPENFPSKYSFRNANNLKKFLPLPCLLRTRRKKGGSKGQT